MMPTATTMMRRPTSLSHGAQVWNIPFCNPSLRWNLQRQGKLWSECTLRIILGRTSSKSGATMDWGIWGPILGDLSDGLVALRSNIEGCFCWTSGIEVQKCIFFMSCKWLRFNSILFYFCWLVLANPHRLFVFSLNLIAKWFKKR